MINYIQGTSSFKRRRFSLRRKRQLTRRLQSRGFSLVEIVIALAVMASTLLVVFGLLGTGLNTFRQAKAVSVSSQIAQQVYSQLESIPFANLVGSPGTPSNRASALASPPGPTPTNSFVNQGNTVQTLYFDEQGNELSTSAGAIYWVNVRILYPSPMLPKTSVNAAAPYLNVDLAYVLVQVAFNPGGLSPAISNSAWTGLSNNNVPMQIANYQFYVARNS